MKKLIYISLLTSLFILAGCSSKESGGGTDTPELEITSGYKNTISENGGEAAITFTTNTAWKASVSVNSSSWCTINTKSGEPGTYTIIATVTANDSYGERNASVTITCGNVKAIAAITQKQNDAILITSDKIECAQSECTAEIEVKANIDYTYEITSGKEWIKESSGTKALKQSVISLDLSENLEESPREGEVTIKGGNITEKVKIYQQSLTESIVITQKEYNITSDSREIAVELKSNADYSIEMPQVDWIKETSTKAYSAYTHYFEIEKNESYDNRRASIIFIDNDSGYKDSVVINQSQVNAIIIAKDEYNVEYTGDTLNFLVSTNTNLEISSDVSWIQQIDVEETKGLEEIPLSFAISRNTSMNERTGIITLSAEGVSQTIKIIQGGNTDVMNITFTHNAQSMTSPTVFGEDVSGTIDWGNSTEESYEKYLTHKYDDTSSKNVSINVVNATGVKFNSIKSISSIDITIKSSQE